MSEELLRKYALVNRKKFIYSLKFKKLPPEIQFFLKKNRKLTKAERYMSAFIQSLVRYGYIERYKSQQIVRMGAKGHYIMPDFFLIDTDAIIEVDGPEHDPSKDTWRDKEVKRLFHIDTIRVTNDDVLNFNDSMRTYILEELSKINGCTEVETKKRVRDYWTRQEAGS